MIVLAISCIMLLLCQADHYVARGEKQNQAAQGEREVIEQPGIKESILVSTIILLEYLMGCVSAS